MHYGYLLIERIPTARVTLPDGTVTDVLEDRAEDAVRAWWQANVVEAPEADEQELAAWERAFAAYRAATTVEDAEGTRGFSSAPVTITKITYPDGHVDDRALGGPTEERIRRRFTAEHPLP